VKTTWTGYVACSLLNNSVLYGMSYFDGVNGKGTLFSINVNGSGFQVLHAFAGGATDGANPSTSGPLILDGTTLYGTTGRGGTADLGTVFKMDINGTAFQVLHSFAGGPLDGNDPLGGVVLNGSQLYGTSNTGGANNKGTVFQINTDGTGLQLLHSFAGSDGSNPETGLTFDGSTLYGTTDGGGLSAKYGVVFAIQIPEPSSAVLAGLALMGFIAFRWRRRGA
jgi:uncharacterized repeat protein (TIGR03803 family)